MDSALLDTEWIWCPGWTDHSGGSAGGFVHFRKFLTIDAVPEKPLLIQITADTKYQLYVNSILVHTGPVKGDEHLWFYDELDIQPFLKLGVNHIAVRVLRFFYATKWATSFPRLPIAGLFVRTPNRPGEGETALKIQSDASWEAAIDLSAKLRVDQPEDDFLHIYEDVDIARSPELEWVPALPLQLPRSHGIAPPWVLSPRLIPFAKVTPVYFKAIHNIRSPVSRAAWERLLLGGKDQNATDDSLALPAGTSHHLELEVDHHLTAMLRFRFRRPELAGSSLRVTYSESYEDVPTSIPYLRRKGDRTDITKKLYGPEDRYIFAGLGGAERAVDLAYASNTVNTEVFSPFHFRTLRYITLDIDVVEQSELVLNGIDLDRTHYPLEIRGGFEMVNEPQHEAYKAIWKTSTTTLINCMHDCYEDCPFYEQLQYAMDVRSSCLFTYVVSGDDRMARQAIIQLHNGYRPGVRLIASRSPAHQLQIIPHFSLFWICTVTDHFEHAGDAAFTRQFLSTCDGILEAFSTRIDPRLGLVSSDDAALATFWDFVDWTDEWRPMGIPPAGRRTGFQTYTNFLYAYALQALARTVSRLGRPALAGEYQKRADGVIGAVRRHCRAGGFFTDGLASSADHSEDFSQHNQIWAVLSGAVAGSEARVLLTRSLPALRDVLSCDRSSDISGEARPKTRDVVRFTEPSMAMSFYTLRALSVAGGTLYDEAFHAFWAPWRRQLDENLTTWCEDDVTKRSDCHAWSCVPLYEFMAEVAGVRPAEPGWGAIVFRPRTALFLEFSGDVPLGGKLAPGLARVSWAREKGLPAGQGSVSAPVSVYMRLLGVEGDGAVPVRVVLPGGRVEEHLGPNILVQFRDDA